MKINLSCPINTTSYGYTSLAVLKELTRLGHEISLFPIGGVEADPADHELIKESISRSQWFDWSAPSIRLYHQFALQPHIGHGCQIGFTIFELDRLKPNEIHQCLSQNMVIVPSKWAARVVQDSIGYRASTSVRTVPLGYDPDIFFPRPIDRNDGVTRWLNCGKWEYRKGHDVLVEIFNRAFTKNDNVELLMANHNRFLTPEETREWENFYKNSPLGDKIKFIPWLPNQSDVAALMSEVDCGIFPSRAEGWNLEAMEMLAMGKEIIITNNSAHTEYCTADNAILIECHEREIAYDSKWFFGDGMWAKLGEDQIEQAVCHLRDVHKRKKEGKLKDHSGSIKDFTWDRAAEKLVDALS